MDVKLYTYTDLPNVANKKTGCELLFDSTTTPGFTVYGDFDPYNAVFYLSEYYPANYAEYTLNSVTYYGACTVSVTTRNEFEYRVTVDPLTTAWYHRVISSAYQYLEYSPGHIGVGEIDPRLERDENLTIIRHKYGSILKDQDFDIWLITANPNGQLSASQKCKLTPGSYSVYVFTRYNNLSGVQHYRRFLRNLFKVQKKYGIGVDIDNYLSSMLRAYVVPHAFFTDTTGLVLGNVELHSLGGNLLDGDNVIAIPSNGDYEEYSAYHVNIQTTSVPTKISCEFHILNDQEGVKRDGTWSLVIPFVGTVSFTPNISFPANAHAIYADITLNPIGGFYVVQMSYATLPDENHPFPNGLYTFPIQENTIIMEAGAPALKAQTAMSDLFGFSLGMSNAKSIERLMSKSEWNALVGERIGFANDAFSLATSGLSSLSSTGGSCNGTVDGSPYRSDVAIDKQITLYIPYHKYKTADIDFFYESYGAPSHAAGIISPLSAGFYQTRRAMFPCGNLPQEIVRQAESACDNGIYTRSEG